jgi:hypothetical protein
LSDAAADAPTQRSPVDRKVGANRRGVDEAHRLSIATFDGWESRKRAFVILVLVMVEPQPAAEADRRRKFGLRVHGVPRLVLSEA